MTTALLQNPSSLEDEEIMINSGNTDVDAADSSGVSQKFPPARLVSSVDEDESSQDCWHEQETRITEMASKLKSHYCTVLHFDINECILVGDEAGGDSRQDSLHKMLAKSAFVQISTEEHKDWSWESTRQMQPTHWWNGLQIAPDGNYDEAGAVDVPPPLYTGWTWPAGCCPYYRTAFKGRAQHFAEPGNHGSFYANTLHTLENRLKFPQTESSASMNADMGSNEALPILSHMLPAFFESLVHFFPSSTSSIDEAESTINKSLSYKLVFRTMGSDLPEIAAAISAFALGQHPDYPHYKNERLILTKDHLFRGRWVKSSQDQPNHNHDNASNKDTDSKDDYIYQLWKYRDEDEKNASEYAELVASGDAAVLDLIHSQTVCGIQDDYRHWAGHAHASWAGKPVWKISHPSNCPNGHDATAGDCLFHHIILDDNIHNLPNDSIVSVREYRALDGAPIQGSVLSTAVFRTLTGPDIQQEHGIHLIRVPTVAPILDSRWFIKKIQQAQSSFLRDIEKNDLP